MGNYPNARAFKNSSNVWVFWEFPSQMPGYLGNFQSFEKFQNLKNIPLHTLISVGIWEISQIPRQVGNFPDNQAFRKFLKFLYEFEGWFIFRILEIFQMTGYLEISQKPRHLGSFSETREFGKFLFLTFLIIAVTPFEFDARSVRLERHLRAKYYIDNPFFRSIVPFRNIFSTIRRRLLG